MTTGEQTDLRKTPLSFPSFISLSRRSKSYSTNPSALVKAFSEVEEHDVFVATDRLHFVSGTIL